MASCSDESIWLRSLLLECGFVIPSNSGFYAMPKSKETPTDHKSYAVLIPPSPVYGDNRPNSRKALSLKKRAPRAQRPRLVA